MSRVAAAIAALVVSGCSGSGAGAFEAPEGFTVSGISVQTGDTAVVGLGVLRQVDSGQRVTLTGLHVDGGQVAAPAGEVLGVKVYTLTGAGGIGAITAEDLSGAHGDDGWVLDAPEGLSVDGSDPRGVVVVVRGRSVGTWSSDTLVVEYQKDGRTHSQRISIGAVVCVVADSNDPPPCDARASRERADPSS